MKGREKPPTGNSQRAGSTEGTRSGASGGPPSEAAAAEAAQFPAYTNRGATGRLKRVALVTMNRLDREALCYALNACQRMNARLDILTNLPPEETDRAVISARGTADTPWRLIRIRESGDEIHRYARNASGLLLIASGIADESTRKLRDRVGSDRTQLGIPWVVVEGKQPHR